MVARLARKYAAVADLTTVLWEDEPLLATEHFQSQIVRPSESDIVVVVLWWRLGTLLPPEQYQGALTGGEVTGTEWEFEDAFAAYQASGKPDLLFYRRNGAPEIRWGATSEASREQAESVLSQQEETERFVTRWLADDRVKRAFWTYDSTTDFEDLFSGHIEKLIDKRLREAGEGTATWVEGSPYRGLQSFELEHANIFFGRTRARNELREALTRQVESHVPFTLVLGASGSGKSSLVKAGLLADLQVPGIVGDVAVVRHAIYQPAMARHGLIEGLAEALLAESALPELAELNYSAASVAGLLRQGADTRALILPPLTTVLATIHQHHSTPLTDRAEVRCLIILDQLEEVFTLGHIAQEEREAFFAAIDALVRSEFVWVVATMRSDFIDAIDRDARLSVLASGAGLFMLKPADEAELGQIIRSPALAAGASFETHPETGIGLDEVIRQEALGQSAPLPLVEFLLDELWNRLDDHVLTYRAYEELGGLAGAIGRRAETLFDALDASAREQLPVLLRTLTTVADDLQTRFAAKSVEPPTEPAARRLLDELIEARLVVINANEAGSTSVRFAHESLIVNWPRARDSLERDSALLKSRRYLEMRERQWQETPDSAKDQRLLTGVDLEDALALKQRLPGELSESLEAFVEASRRLAGRARRRRRIAMGVGALLLGAAVAGLWFASLDDWEQHRLRVDLQLLVLGPQQPVMRLIPAGKFVMGSDVPNAVYRRWGIDNADEKPAHAVCFAEPFEMSATEVTNGAFGEYLVASGVEPSQENGYHTGILSRPDHPVTNVSVFDVRDYIRWLNRETGKRYRLPSESEWEYAARGGSPHGLPYYWGERIGEGNAACRGCNTEESDSTHPVGSFPPNGYDLQDMLGNVFEITADCWHDNYFGAPADGSAWNDAQEMFRGCLRGNVIRGGGFGSPPVDLVITLRDSVEPGIRQPTIGFRLARDLAAAETSAVANVDCGQPSR